VAGHVGDRVRAKEKELSENSRFAGTVDPAWLDRHVEEILEPGLPIVDPHHHLWAQPGNVYLMPELLADLASGHDVRATVFEECRAMYRADGPDEWRSLGETEFVNGVAAMSASGAFGPARVCAAIVGNVDLRLGDGAEPVLRAHVAAGGGRFRGVRFATVWHADERLHRAFPEPGMLGDARVRRGLACLDALGLSLDAWVYHTQLDEVADVARAFPGLTIVLNHIGVPILGGPYAGRRDEVVADWKAAMKRLAEHPNVFVKVGAIPIRLPGDPPADKSVPPASDAVARAWRPFVEPCVELFGAGRCMFESNFPVQKRWCGYAVAWNAFKRIAAGASAQEKRALFGGAAARAYRLTRVDLGAR